MRVVRLFSAADDNFSMKKTDLFSADFARRPPRRRAERRAKTRRKNEAGNEPVVSRQLVARHEREKLRGFRQTGSEAAKREKMFAEIAKAGFKTVRIPINFGAWANYEKPFRWENEEGLKTADSFVKWARGKRPERDHRFAPRRVRRQSQRRGDDRKNRLAVARNRARYKNTNPERVFFELRNEPHDIKAEEWRAQAEAISKPSARSRRAHSDRRFSRLEFARRADRFETVCDSNIIYTFHYYDPFHFHASGRNLVERRLARIKKRAVSGSRKRKSKRFPRRRKENGSKIKLKVTEWKRFKPEKIYADLKAAKDWSVKNKVPIFLGEFGSFGKYADEDRCRHAETVLRRSEN
jgi:hypothetical protein